MSKVLRTQSDWVTVIEMWWVSMRGKGCRQSWMAAVPAARVKHWFSGSLRRGEVSLQPVSKLGLASDHSDKGRGRLGEPVRSCPSEALTGSDGRR